MTSQAESSLLSRLIGQSLPIDAKSYGMLYSYLEVVDFFLRTYTTNEVLAEANNKVVMFFFCQSSSITEQDYFDMLWNKTIR